MRVLFLTNIPSPYRVDFFQELGKYCELTVLYELAQARDRDKAWHGTVKEKSFREVYLKQLHVQTSSAWCPSVTEYLKKEDYDIIVVGCYATPTAMTAIHYMKKHHIPYLLNADGGIVPIKERRVKAKIKRYFISGASGYLCTGGVCEEYLLHYGAEKEAIFRYPFTSVKKEAVCETVSSDETRKAMREKLGICEERVALYVGSYIHRKGIDVLLKAVARMKENCAFYLVGGEASEEYASIVREHHLSNIHFLPFMTGDKVAEYYRAADFFVLPTREDIWGLVINEALAAGLPVITTTNCLAGVELLSECGILVKPEDEAGLAQMMDHVLAQPKLRDRMAGKALAKASEYTIEKMAERHMEIFKEIL